MDYSWCFKNMFYCRAYGYDTLREPESRLQKKRNESGHALRTMYYRSELMKHIDISLTLNALFRIIDIGGIWHLSDLPDFRSLQQSLFGMQVM